jgi:hypothetical protein
MAPNPFELIDQRLTNIEKLLIDLPDMLSPQKKEAQQADLLDNLPDRLKSRDIKKLFNISSVTIWQWEKKSILKPQKINRRKFYSKKDVLKLLNEKGKK